MTALEAEIRAGPGRDRIGDGIGHGRRARLGAQLHLHQDVAEVGRGHGHATRVPKTSGARTRSPQHARSPRGSTDSESSKCERVRVPQDFGSTDSRTSGARTRSPQHARPPRKNEMSEHTRERPAQKRSQALAPTSPASTWFFSSHRSTASASHERLRLTPACPSLTRELIFAERQPSDCRRRACVRIAPSILW